jgi:hypothetical protein
LNSERSALKRISSRAIHFSEQRRKKSEVSVAWDGVAVEDVVARGAVGLGFLEGVDEGSVKEGLEEEEERTSICSVASALKRRRAGPVTETRMCRAPSSLATPTPPEAPAEAEWEDEERREAEDVRQATSES